MAALGWLVNLGFAGGTATTPSITTLVFHTLTEAQAEALSEEQFTALLENYYATFAVVAGQMVRGGPVAGQMVRGGAVAGEMTQ
ncbi:MAG TPA: hypothetical protein VMY42_28795 [Thermoguttaceae bacterium]|nr:hypothetical protein [Thermoguttaceae bacterium]